MSKSKLFLSLVVFATFFSCFPPVLYPYYEKQTMPQRLIDEREAFIERHFDADHRLYLQRVGTALRGMADINESTNKVFNAIPDTEQVNDRIIGNIQKATQTAYEYILDAPSGEAMSEVIEQILGEIAGPIVSTVIDMIQFAMTVDEIGTLYSDAANLSSGHAGFWIKLNEFHRQYHLTPQMMLTDAAQRMRNAAGSLTEPLRLEELKEFFEEEISYSDRMIELLKWDFGSYIVPETDLQRVHKWQKELLEINAKFIKSIFDTGRIVELGSKINEVKKEGEKGKWYTWTIQTAIITEVKQFEVNKKFCEEILKQLNMFPSPERPAMPDLKVESLQVWLPRENGEEKALEDLKIGEEVRIVAVIKNAGELASDPSVARMQPCGKEGCYIDVPALGRGETHQVIWHYTLEKVKNIFTVTANYDKKAWEVNPDEWDNQKKISLNLKQGPDLNIEFSGMSERFYKGQEGFVKVRVGNDGNNTTWNPNVTCSAGRQRLGEQKLSGELPRGKFLEATFKWTPKEKGPCEITCEAQKTGGTEDLNQENDKVKASVEVFLPENGWQILTDSLTISPAKPKVDEETRIFFTVVNNGASDFITADIYVDEERIEFLQIHVEPEANKKVGLSNEDKIIWKARGGDHTIKVVLNPNRVKTAGVVTKSVSVGTLMPGVGGVDLVLEEKNVSYKNGKITAKIYNRGLRPAENVLFTCCEQLSYREKPDAPFYSVNLGTIRSHELRTITINKETSNSKLIVAVDRDNKISEADENNNEVQLTVGHYVPFTPEHNIREDGPDLIVAQVVNLDRPLDADETRQINVLIGNLNLLEAKDIRVDYEFHSLGGAQRDEAHGYLKGTRRFAEIKPEDRKEFSFNYKAGYPGPYQLDIRVDPLNKIKETNEANNELSVYFSVEGEVTSRMFFSGKNAELSIDQEIRVLTPEPIVGQAVNFEFTVYNNSDIDIWGADVEMFIDGELVFGEPLGTFADRSYRELVFDHTFSKSGTHMIKIMVDSKEAIPEVNESNNVVETTIDVQPGLLGTGMRDVAVTNISLSKTSCLQGEPITLETTVKNTGQDILRGILVTMRTENRPPFFVTILPIIDPGEEKHFSKTLPALIAGDHHIIVTVDGKNIISEEDEENNVKTILLTVKPISREQLKEMGAGVKTRGTSAVINKVNQIKGAVDNWLRGLGGQQ